MKKKRIFTDFFSLTGSNLNVKRSVKESESWIHHILPADADVPQMEEEKNNKPFMIIRTTIGVLFFVLFAKIFFLQFLAGDANMMAAEDNRVRADLLYAPRGIVYDKHGTVLVKNVPNFEVVIVPSDLSKEDEERRKIFEVLEKTINLSVSKAKEKIEERGVTSPLPLVIKNSIGRDTSLLLESRLEGAKGVYVQTNPIREYLDNGLLSHVLGYAGRISEEEYDGREDRYAMTDYIGKTGLEFSYEDALKGENGFKRFETDASGKVTKQLEDIDPENGNSLVLSIDFDLQKKMAEFLRAGLEKANVKKGVAIAQNPKTGEILGMVNMPSYDNNLFAKGISDDDYKNLLENNNNPLIFRAISGQYPSGSVIKPFLAAGALEEGVINENTTVLSTGGIDVGEFNFPDWKSGGHGVTNVIKAIAESVNTFFYSIGGGYNNIQGMGAAKMKGYLERFGFNKTSNIDIPGEADGSIPDADWKEEVKGEPWYLGDTYHMAIGQGDVLVTPLQMLNATSAIANGGKLLEPTLVSRIVDSRGQDVDNHEIKVLNENFIKDYNIDVVRRGMRQAILTGSGRSLNTLPVEIAGKTGTAQFSNDLNRKHAWFEAFAPYNDPDISLVVLVEEGGGGDETAAPIAKEIFKWYFENKD